MRGPIPHLAPPADFPEALPSVAVQRLFDIQVAAVTMSDAMRLVEQTIARGSRLHVGVVNAAKIVNMQRQPSLRRAVLSCDVILADGMSIVWASRMLRRPLPERVAGIDLMSAMLDRASQVGWRVYCLGAEPRVLDTAIAQMRRQHPGVQFVGWHHGYFTAAEEPAVVQSIAAARPDILLVGMTSPRKEEFLARWHGTLSVAVCHGVGGSFDVIGGKVRRAPELWQRAGLEWLYRLLQEPRRMFKRYATTNARFVGLVARAALGRRS